MPRHFKIDNNFGDDWLDPDAEETTVDRGASVYRVQEDGVTLKRLATFNKTKAALDYITLMNGVSE